MRGSVLPAVLSLAIIDSINPASITGALYLAGSGRKRRLRLFILAVSSAHRSRPRPQPDHQPRDAAGTGQRCRHDRLGAAPASSKTTGLAASVVRPRLALCAGGPDNGLRPEP